MGAMQRRKGHAFERDIAKAYRAKWPELASEIRRSQQAHSAFEPDVVVPGVPLWTECTVGVAPDPKRKLLQAERDTCLFTESIYPVVVWRKSGRRTVHATMRLRTLRVLLGHSDPDCPLVDRDVVVTVSFEDL